MNRIVMKDSYSDGMCGWVEMRDNVTGSVSRVHWSVTNPTCQSQSEAIDLAKRNLVSRRNEA